MNRKAKGFAYFAAGCAAALFAVIMTLNVSAAEGYEAPLSEISDNITVGMTIEDCSTNRWVSESGSTLLSTAAGKSAVLVTAVSGDPSAYLELDAVDLSRYGSLSINIFAEGNGTADVTVSGFGSAYTAKVETGKWYRVYISLENAGVADRLAVSAAGAGALYIGRIHTTLENQSAAAQIMSCERVRAVTGDVVYGGEGYTITSDDGGNAKTVGYGVFFEGNDGAVVRVTTDGSTKGSLTFGVQTNEARNGYADCGTVTLREGSGSYLFYLKNAAEVKSYMLKYTGISGTVSMTGVRFYPFSGDSAGRTASLTIKRSSGSDENGGLEIEGTLDSASCVKYIDGKVALFEVPYWMTEKEGFTSEPISDTGVSTKFTFDVSADSLIYPAELCRFVAAIITADGSIVPVSVPTAIYGSASQQSFPAFGMTTSDGSGLIESLADFAVIDVDASDFSDGVGSGRLHTYGGKYYNMDSDTLKSLDKAVRTARVTCRGFYVRLNGISSAVSEEDAYRICALTDFLCSRYSDLSGALMDFGSDVPSAEFTEEYGAYAEGCAAVYQLICGTASKYIQPFRMIVNFGYWSESGADAGVFCGILSAALKSSGASPCTAMLSCEGDGASAESASAGLAGMYYEASSIGYAASSGLILRWCPSEDTEDTSAVCEKLLSAQTGSVKTSLLLSADKISVSRALYDKLFSMSRGSSFVNYTGTAQTSSVPSVNSFDIWNFSSSYSVQGWIAAGMCTEVKTQINIYLTSLGESQVRILKATFGASDGVAGYATAAGRLEASADISGADAVEVYLLATGHRDTVPLYITFGGEGGVFRYDAAVTSGVPSFLICSIPEGVAQKLDYVCVTSAEGEPCEVDIVRVSGVTSGTPSEPEEGGTDGKNNSEDGGRGGREVYYIILAVLLVTAVLFAVIFRRDRETLRPEGTAKEHRR